MSKSSKRTLLRISENRMIKGKENSIRSRLLTWKRAAVAANSILGSVSLAGNSYVATYANGELTLQSEEMIVVEKSVKNGGIGNEVDKFKPRDTRRYKIQDSQVREHFERIVDVRGLTSASLYWLRRKDNCFKKLQEAVEQSANESFTPLLARSAPAVMLWIILIVFVAVSAEGLSEEFAAQQPEKSK